MKPSPLKTSPDATWFFQMRRNAVRVWQGFREWCGDAAYESYLRSRHTKRGCEKPLTPAEFYVDQMNRKYSKPNRCC